MKLQSPFPKFLIICLLLYSSLSTILILQKFFECKILQVLGPLHMQQ
jgi:hypothetical protein